tara:strand:- start:1041 stop:2453 length:1413 start_codon:yes stop_codon:yes gene_type:complete
MATVTTTRIWNGLRVTEVTDTATGTMYIRQYGSSATDTSGTLLAQSPPANSATNTTVGNNWHIADLTTFTRVYNNRPGNNNQISSDQLRQQFFNNGRELFNDDRADVLNDQSATDRTYYASLGIPGVTLQNTGQTVSNSGALTSQNPIASLPGTLSDGSIPLSSDINDAPDPSRAVGSLLRYPEMNLASMGYDYIQIRAYNYVGSMSTSSNQGARGDARYQTQVGPMIQLPMQPNLSETNATDWAQDTMNAFQQAAGQAALNTINDASGLTGAAVGAGAAVAAGGPGGALVALAGKVGFELGKEGAKLINEENIAGAAAYFAGQAVGANVLGRSTGQVINPNMELTFNGPKMRTFSFNFRLTPRTESEARVIRSMIKFFKQYMAPEQTESEMFLKPPKLFRLEYLYNGDSPHPWLNKFKPCALQNFEVNYTPDNSYMTYDDGSMTSYNISLGFGEIEPIYSNEYSDGSFQ